MAFLFHHHSQHQSIHPTSDMATVSGVTVAATVTSETPSYFLDHTEVHNVNFVSDTKTATTNHNCTQEPLPLQTLSRGGQCHSAISSHLNHFNPSIDTSVGQCLINDGNSESSHFLDQSLTMATFPQASSASSAISVLPYGENRTPFKSPSSSCHPRNPSQVTSSSDYHGTIGKSHLMRTNNKFTSTSGKKSRNTTYKGKSRQWDDAKRERANEQERRRMQELNEAMDRLRGCIPDRMRNPIKKLSKIDTLNAAIDYIRYLEQEIRVLPNGGQL